MISPDLALQNIKKSLAELPFISPDDKKEILNIVTRRVEKRIKEAVQLPLTIFKTKGLSSLEIIVKYCSENLGLGFTETAKLLNRSPKTIWATYSKAKKKCPGIITVETAKFFIPTSIFQQRKLSVLESIVTYLKENYDLDFNSIAKLLGKSYSTILTVNRRARLKR